jgi:hypothetical protein
MVSDGTNDRISRRRDSWCSGRRARSAKEFGRRPVHFVRRDHTAEMLDLFPDRRLAVLPATRHTEVMQRSDMLRPLLEPFLASPVAE